jgi:hypothetical protein
MEKEDYKTKKKSPFVLQVQDVIGIYKSAECRKAMSISHANGPRCVNFELFWGSTFKQEKRV